MSLVENNNKFSLKCSYNIHVYECFTIVHNSNNCFIWAIELCYRYSSNSIHVLTTTSQYIWLGSFSITKIIQKYQLLVSFNLLFHFILSLIHMFKHASTWVASHRHCILLAGQTCASHNWSPVGATHFL